jgi:hypothetical protein
LARVSLKKAPLYVNVDENKEAATAEGLEQVIQVFFNLKGLCRL